MSGMDWRGTETYDPAGSEEDGLVGPHGRRKASLRPESAASPAEFARRGCPRVNASDRFTLLANTLNRSQLHLASDFFGKLSFSVKEKAIKHP
jgi:hypothetical protein